MKLANGLMIAGMLAMTAIPAWAGNDGGVGGVDYDALSGEARVLTEQEILDLLARSGQASAQINPNDVDIQYMGAESEIAVSSELCCENVNEVVTERTQVQETETFIDAVTSREIIQPVERTLIQPVTRQVIDGRTVTETAPVQYEEEVLPVIVDEDTVPAITEQVIPQETFETREEITERYEDAVARRDVIQPVVRTTVVPVQRRIDRPVVVEETAPTQYQTRTAPVRVIPAPNPTVDEFTTVDVTETVVEEYSDEVIDVVTQRDIIQPVERTIVQPVERRILRPQTETVTAPVEYREQYLQGRTEYGPRPEVQENVIPQYQDRTVLEVSDVYVDRVTRNIVQPVEVTVVQPVERQVIRGRSETVTAPTVYETEYLPGRVIEAQIPQTRVNYIPQVNEIRREDYRETYFNAVTRREIVQPIVTTRVQPIEVVRYNPVTETVTAPTQYETIRANQVVLNVGGGCVCSTGY
ncbi:hypothetical protein [Ponticaulis sp.]|uniref:hypothetical protein n=1 Tax=Ponticaulis sp. TaxID=2020902 RepID=UPI000B6F9425|nr:hypothetical protein [Ponticaulis sp.]MAJ09393.1 hypothetical protein [Ponticaulis sp.]RPG18744.1 MAG: hypothetical protein CBC85_000465 [Hyphomonadaceae bacterium TMED125]HBH89601.1 hypothetical protein [Hyphomonadaceae bacterium]HBJ93799.1 hypothetical protein [Hyphomonadaceae bacterium]|tara:strand:- start:923 stop:2332 length:1410 start_codon:yes stop_codon:yes gene_type:complete